MAANIIPYTAVAATKAMRNSPRFGHTDDVSSFLGDQSEIEDYVMGLIFGACIILGMFLIWFILLLIFKCLGKRVGHLSGARFSSNKKALGARIIFLISAVSVIIFAVLLVLNGISNLQESISAVSNANQDIQRLQNDALAITDSLDSLREPALDVREQLIDLDQQGTFCPADASLQEDTGYDFDGLIDQAITLLNDLGDFLQGDISAMRDAIDESKTVTSDIEEGIDELDLRDWQSLLLITTYILVPSFLLVALMLVFADVSISAYTCMVQWFFLPILTAITSFAFILAALLLVIAVINADFCSGRDPASDSLARSPDLTVLNMLDRANLASDSLEDQAVRYYVQQCAAEDPFAFIGDYREEIEGASERIGELGDALDAITVNRLNLICGKDFSPFELLIANMNNNLGVLEVNAVAGQELLSCERISPIYTSTVYDGTCTYAVTGVTWTFASFLVIGFMGMMMLTFRSALWDAGEDDEFYESGAVVRNELVLYDKELETDQDQPSSFDKSSRGETLT